MRAAWSFMVYIKRWETSGGMKYDKTYSPATLTLSHSLSNAFHLFSPFATEISEVLALFRRGIEPAWWRSPGSLLSWMDRMSDVYREERGLCTPYWCMHHASPTNAPRKNKNNCQQIEQFSTHHLDPFERKVNILLSNDVIMLIYPIL